MLKNNNPSILYCCNGFINFLIIMVKKLVYKFECENIGIYVHNRSIDIYD